MRILYGANSQGQGHLSKARVLIPLLEARGHTVRVISSGPPVPPEYDFRDHQHFSGLPYVVTDGTTDFTATFKAWLRAVPAMFRDLFRVRRIVHDWQPDLILSDFEPLTASPLLHPPCEVLAVCRQVALFDPQVPLPDGHTLDKQFARTVIRLFTAGADRYLGYHYAPASYRCIPPSLREDLPLGNVERGDHLLAYCHYTSVEPLIAWANRERCEVRAYGFTTQPRGRVGHVWFRSPSRESLLEDLRTARAVVTNAGLSLPIEAFMLTKPTLVVPIARQWEQIVNAFQLDQLGIAKQATDYEWSMALNLPAPAADHPLRRWLRSPLSNLVDRLVGPAETGELPRPQAPVAGRAA